MGHSLGTQVISVTTVCCHISGRLSCNVQQGLMRILPMRTLRSNARVSITRRVLMKLFSRFLQDTHRLAPVRGRDFDNSLRRTTLRRKPSNHVTNRGHVNVNKRRLPILFHRRTPLRRLFLHGHFSFQKIFNVVFHNFHRAYTRYFGIFFHCK